MARQEEIVWALFVLGSQDHNRDHMGIASINLTFSTNALWEEGNVNMHSYCVSSFLIYY